MIDVAGRNESGWRGAKIGRKATDPHVLSVPGQRGSVTGRLAWVLPHATCILFLIALFAVASCTKAYGSAFDQMSRRELKQHELAMENPTAGSFGSVFDGMSRRELKQHELAMQKAASRLNAGILDGMSRREFKQYELARHKAGSMLNASILDGLSRREFKQVELSGNFPQSLLATIDVAKAAELSVIATSSSQVECFGDASFGTTVLDFDPTVAQSGWLITSSTTAQAVPEPSSWTLLCVCGLALGRLRRQHSSEHDVHARELPDYGE